MARTNCNWALGTGSLVSERVEVVTARSICRQRFAPASAATVTGMGSSLSAVKNWPSRSQQTSPGWSSVTVRLSLVAVMLAMVGPLLT